MKMLFDTFAAAWELLLDASVYILFGLLVSGLLRVFLNPGAVARHLGHGRFRSVFKAALLGIPIPLCSCGVLPAAVGLKKQGANNGAVTAFMIATPESGVDSIAITYALLDPVMTVVRPLAAFCMAAVAGVAENFRAPTAARNAAAPDLSCPVDGCCSGVDCPPETHQHHHRLGEKLATGLRYALTDVWNDIAGWFFVGLLLAGLITVLLPPETAGLYLGGGLTAMLLMLLMGVPLYICATASTPIAAALILKGVSPGAALVFLLAGPATNLATLTVLLGLLGRRATAIYLGTIAVGAVLFGLAVDLLYGSLGWSAQALVGQAADIVPAWLTWGATVVLLAVSIGPLARGLATGFRRLKARFAQRLPAALAQEDAPGKTGACSGAT